MKLNFEIDFDFSLLQAAILSDGKDIIVESKLSIDFFSQGGSEKRRNISQNDEFIYLHWQKLNNI